MFMYGRGDLWLDHPLLFSFALFCSFFSVFFPPPSRLLLFYSLVLVRRRLAPLPRHECLGVVAGMDCHTLMETDMANRHFLKLLIWL